MAAAFVKRTRSQRPGPERPWHGPAGPAGRAGDGVPKAGPAVGAKSAGGVVKEDYKTPHPWQKKRSDERPLGLVMVNTGPGKGKTTAALGLALRAIGHRHRVKMIQFMKGDPFYGEILVRERLPELEIEQYGLDRFVDPKNPEPEQVARAQAGLEAARQAVLSGDYNVVILDEVNVAMNFGLVPVEAVADLLRRKPRHVEVVLTGRDAPQAIIDLADYVNVVTDLKHPYSKNVPARVGIEF
jgi:cob(I)alamin adenosyltransferase